MNVTLTEHFEGFIQTKIQEGQYSTASEVIRDGLRLLEKQNQAELQGLQAVREYVQKGLDSPLIDFDAKDIKQRGRQLLRQLADKS